MDVILVYYIVDVTCELDQGFWCLEINQNNIFWTRNIFFFVFFFFFNAGTLQISSKFSKFSKSDFKTSINSFQNITNRLAKKIRKIPKHFIVWKFRLKKYKNSQLFEILSKFIKYWLNRRIQNLQQKLLLQFWPC